MADESKRPGESAKGKAQYELDAIAMREKTARLRALRLAKEAAEGKPVEAAPAAKRAPKAASSKARGKQPSKSLSQFLAAEKDSGRSS